MERGTGYAKYNKEPRKKTELELDAAFDRMLKYTQSYNEKCNTEEQMIFDSPNIRFDFQEDEKRTRRINEITTQGEGDMTIEVGEDGSIIIQTDIGCTLKRVFYNRLTVNYKPRVTMKPKKSNKEMFRLCDEDYCLYDDPNQYQIISEGQTKEEVVSNYIMKKYGNDDVRFDKWTVSGVGIKFINKRNIGRLYIYNRSFDSVVLSTQNTGNVIVYPGKRKCF